jgi:uncharacterized phage infection (PIP) family protein YhgE
LAFKCNNPFVSFPCRNLLKTLLINIFHIATAKKTPLTLPITSSISTITSSIGRITSSIGIITSGISTITSGIGIITSGISTITSGISIITSGIGTITSGIGIITTGLGMITSGFSTITIVSLPIPYGINPMLKIIRLTRFGNLIVRAFFKTMYPPKCILLMNVSKLQFQNFIFSILCSEKINSNLKLFSHEN